MSCTLLVDMGAYKCQQTHSTDIFLVKTLILYFYLDHSFIHSDLP